MASHLHYKKKLLVGNDKKDESANSTSVPSGLDVNQSIADQIARLNKGNNATAADAKPKWEEQEAAVSLATLAYNGSSSSSSVSSASNRPPQDDNFKNTDSGKSGGRPANSEQNNNMYSSTRTSDVSSKEEEHRSHSRSSVTTPTTEVHPPRPPKPNSSSPISYETSKSKYVEPYRDPELLKKDMRIREMQQQQQQQQLRSRTHTPIPTTTAAVSYPGVHTPIPSPLPTAIPPGQSAVLTSQNHPLLNPLASYASLSPHLHLDRASSVHGLGALVQQQQAAAATAAATAAHLQQLHLLQQQQQQQQQQQNQLLSSYTLQPNSPHTRQLELLWQQKYPKTPLPPPWMLHQYQDELLRDVHLLQRDLLERERREREILEKERIERERAERERAEREQRERAERERLERERAERERAERERQEREHQERERREKLERERMERERLERLERERAEKERQSQEEQQRLDRARILRESSDVADAVNAHFKESFIRLASSQKGSQPQPPPHMLMPPGQYPHHLVMMSQQHAALLAQHQQAEADKSKMAASSAASDGSKPRVSPHEASKSYAQPPVDLKAAHSMYTSMFAAHAAGKAAAATSAQAQVSLAAGIPTGKMDPNFSGIPSGKIEPNFSLYGYQPHLHQMYISQEKLFASGLKEDKMIPKSEIKTEPTGSQGPPMDCSNKRGFGGMASPPPLIRDNKSVIVENKAKDMSLASASLPTHQHGSITLGTALPKQEVKPPVSMATNTTVPSSTMAAASILASMPSYRGQGPPQPSAGLNLTMVKQEQPSEESTKSTGPGPMPHSGSHIAQPPTSLPVSAYRYGTEFVPNPLYSQSGVKQENRSSASPVPPPNRPPSAHSPNSVAKRRSPKEVATNAAARKKPKVDGVEQKEGGYPVTQTVTSTCSTSLAQAGSSMNSAAALTSAALRNTLTAGTYMDSFRSFVENAVQVAFLQDQDLSNNSSGSNLSISGSTKPPGPPPTSSSEQKPESSAQPTKVTVPPVTLPSSVVPSATVGTSSTVLTTSTAAVSTISAAAFPQIPSLARPDPANTPGGASVSSASSIMDTINRVANGCMDTDSDTLSAPSPPPQLKGSGETISPSPHKASSGSHTKGFKKAWLQRYSDQDSKDKPFHPLIVNDNSNCGAPSSTAGSYRSENSMDSLPPSTKDDRTKSPAPRVKELKNREDDQTSSASEAESQEQAGSKKKSKGGKKRQSQGDKKAKTDAKKPKMAPESVMDTAVSSPAPSTSSNSGKKSKKKGKKQVEDEDCSPAPPPKASTPQPQPKQEEAAPAPPPPEEPKITKPPKKSAKAKVEPPAPEPPKPVQTDSEVKMERKLSGKGGLKDKGSSLSTFLASRPLNKESINKLKKSLDPFLQDGSCTDVTPKLTKCRECKMPPNQRNKKLPNIFCRFYAFRRLRYSPKGYLTNAGFSEPSDADADDIELWFPCMPVTEPSIGMEMAKYIITNVGDRFCELVEQERIAMSWVSPDTKIAWKRAVQGVREMCDVCDTTLFNMHWVCHKCGFVVCIDCYRLRSRKNHNLGDSSVQEGHKWLTCSVSRQAHEPEKLMLTQIIPSDVLWVLGRLIHELREKWNIPADCPCGRNRLDQILAPRNGLTQPTYTPKSSKDKPMVNGDHHIDAKVKQKLEEIGTNFDPLNMLAEAAVCKQDSEKNLISDKYSKGQVCGSQNGEASAEDKNSSQCSTLRDLLTRSGGQKNGGSSTGASSGASAGSSGKKSEMMQSTFEDIIQKVAEKNQPLKTGEGHSPKRISISFKHYVPRNGTQMQGREIPIPTFTLKETEVLFPDVKHAWLDNGRVLRLLEPRSSKNLKIFQQQWRRAQPVIVSNCHEYYDHDLWKPSSFARDFGDIKNDLVNCSNHLIIMGHKMKSFWEGFEKISARIKDNKHNPMILKLKDWPPTEDFAELLPKRFRDLMQYLPLPEYTNHNGVFNLASRLPEFFVKPDLGPKMYNAYGSAHLPHTGTTNLHLDVSDAVNIMMYVGIPVDDKDNSEQVAALDALTEAGVCELTRKRVAEAGEKPGALWHIFDPEDADKIRDLLNKVAEERGDAIEKHHDPIHDQSWYLDSDLRELLLRDYGVQGYSIVQCLGDAVFIPAGAPHQVRNLHSCIKAAEDFVSPENMNYCFRMTQEFRQLSDTHSNHEDKLQVKNIIYHAVKDAVAVLRDHETNNGSK